MNEAPSAEPIGQPAPPRGRSRRRRLLFALAALALTLLVVLLGLEVGLRLFWDGFYVKSTGEHNRHSPTREWENTPNWKGTLHESEFLMHITHDSHGFRGPEVPAEKPAGKTRVLVLGDSMTYGIGVNDDETFCARMAALDPSLEVINAGVNGYGTSQELLLLREVGLALKPDVVIVAIFFNDLGNSYHRRAIGFSVRDGALVYEPSPSLAKPRRRRRASPLRYSYAYRFLSDRLRVVKYALQTAVGARDEGQDLLNVDSSEPAWQLHLALLDEIIDTTHAAGAKVLVTVIPSEVDIDPERKVIGLEPKDHQIQDRIRAWVERRGVPFVDLIPAVREAARRSGTVLYYPKDRHPIPACHDAIAPVLVEALSSIRRAEQGGSVVEPPAAPRTD